jgi:uncharacterized protein (DUF2141 family)
MLIRFVITILIACLPALCISSFLPATEEGLTITVAGLRNHRGYVLLSLFKDGAGFPGDPAKAFRKEKSAISGNQVVIHFPGIPAGNYAIVILHDENDDMKMNTNWLGLPREGYGFSNNVMGSLGPPAYNRASFKHYSRAANRC